MWKVPKAPSPLAMSWRLASGGMILSELLGDLS